MYGRPSQALAIGIKGNAVDVNGCGGRESRGDDDE